MKRLFALFLLLIVSRPTMAQNAPAASNERISRHLTIREVEIVGRRPMKEIGVQQTKLDSVVLKENIALSMADVLTFNSSIFVKSYGRATLSTVAFRGTSPSHTQVTWNGMRINSPMLGMTDFSLIPAYFIDDAALLHGTSSVSETGGGLGGAVKLSTRPAQHEGFGLQYVQGIGSFQTFDEFLRLTYGNERWQLSTRVVYASSPNEYKYRNRDKKENIYDELMNIVSQYYPTERNRSGAYKDLHLLQEAYYNAGNGNRLGWNVWYLSSNRELPMLTTSYADEQSFENRQREETLRTVLSWDHLRTAWKVGAKAGYIHTWMAYDYRNEVRGSALDSTLGNQSAAFADGTMTRSRSRIHTLYGQIGGERALGKWYFTADLSAHQHLVESRDKNILRIDGDRAIVGYDKGRIELSGALSAKWRPTDRLGAGLTLREEFYGTELTPIIPALFVDGVLSKRGNLTAKASLSRNYRFPTLNDLYFLPGGNPDLKPESGWTYDVGLSFAVGRSERYRLAGSLTWFDSHIDDWIIWLPTIKGYYAPRNLKRVHAYGLELKTDAEVALGRDCRAVIAATASWTPSINEGEKLSEADRSVGKQLPYVPELSASMTAQLDYRSWSLLYKWCYYDERYTMTSNDRSLTGHLPRYYMNNLSLEKRFALRWADLSVKGAINNLFDEEYLTVLSRPMPGINYEIFIGITPRWGKKSRR